MAPLGGVPHSTSALILEQTQRHTIAARLTYTQGEHVNVHRDIFGPKGMLAFAPRFFYNKNLQKKSALQNTSLYILARLRCVCYGA